MTFPDRLISAETISAWEGVAADDFTVPTERPLAEMTTELTTMLADPDPHHREVLAFATLNSWIARGEYDDLLIGLGDGMSAGLSVGLGGSDDGVFRRSFSAKVLACCIDRDTAAPSVPDTQILLWGDRLVTWWLDERDLRGYVVDQGWAHAVAHGADAIGALGSSPHLGPAEQHVMLQVLAERLCTPTDHLFTTGEPDRCAAAVMRILQRNDITSEVLEPWIEALAAAASASDQTGHDPTRPQARSAANVQAFLRTLYLHLSLSSPAPPVRADLLLLLIDALKASNADYFDPDRVVGSSLPS